MRSWMCAACGLMMMGIAFAGGPVVEESIFQEGALPDGWQTYGADLISPAYSNSVTHVALTYGASGADASGTLAIFASNHASQVESKIADLNALTSAARFDFAKDTDFLSFRLVTNGLSLVSFAVTWMDTRLFSPTNISIASNTGSSFDLSWDAVEGAVGYRIDVWTNKVVGATAGVATWDESFSDMESGTGALMTKTENRLAKADLSDWTNETFNVTYVNGFLLDNGGGIRLGTTTATGCIDIPHVVAAGENALRVSAARYGQSKSQQLAALCVSDGGATTNLVGTFSIDCNDTYISSSPDVFDVAAVLELPDSAVGTTLVLQSVCGSDGKEARIAISEIEFLSGYTPGTSVRDMLREANVASGVTSCTFAALPSVAVQASVQALAAKEADHSPASAPVEIDLANPPPVPQLAISGWVVSNEGGYHESFDALNGLSSAVWTDGITLPYWQAGKGEMAADKITTASGLSNKSTGGLYAYHGTNKTGVANYSLAALANKNNKMAFGFAVTNDTDVSLFNFALAFTACQWTFSSSGSSPRTVDQSLRFSYLITNELVSVAAAGQWIDVPAFTFDATSPAANSLEGAGAHADYTTGSVRVPLSAALGVTLHAGEVLLLRWTPDPAPSGEVLGIDDLVLTCERRRAGMTVHVVKMVR